jgi:N-acetylglucosamine-6-phosphate deacetylase
MEFEGRCFLGAGTSPSRARVTATGGLLALAPGAAASPGAGAEEPVLVAPGFVNLHVHGGRGLDVNALGAEGREGLLGALAAEQASQGVTAFLPTLVPAPPEALCRALEAIARHVEAARRETGPPRGARVLGAYLEGPFVSPRRAGALAPDALRAPDGALLEDLLAAAAGTLRIMTVAPELPGALAIIERLAAAGVVPAVGHSDGTAADLRRAVAAGARHVTHFFNAMRGFGHREVGLVGGAWLEPGLTFEIIGCGAHLAPDAVRLHLRLAGPGRTALVTDAIAARGLGDGPCRLGGLAVLVTGGVARLAEVEGHPLAGSVVAFDEALRFLVERVGVAPAAAIAMATEAPARLLAYEGGRLAEGAPADVVRLDGTLRPLETYVGGHRVWRRDEA